MAYSPAGLKLAVDGVASATFISFHTADPGTTGASEVAMTRPATTWGTAANGVRAGSEVSAAIPGGTTVTHWGIWTAASGGSFIYGGALAAPEAFGSAGTLKHTPTISAVNVP